MTLPFSFGLPSTFILLLIERWLHPWIESETKKNCCFLLRSKTYPPPLNILQLQVFSFGRCDIVAVAQPFLLHLSIARIAKILFTAWHPHPFGSFRLSFELISRLSRSLSVDRIVFSTCIRQYFKSTSRGFKKLNALACQGLPSVGCSCHEV